MLDASSEVCLLGCFKSKSNAGLGLGWNMLCN